MKKTLAITITLAGMVAASPVHAALNLLSDATFNSSETGVLSSSSTPWYDPFSSGNVAINGSLPLGSSTDNGVISGSGALDQSLSGLVTSGTGYTINLWLADPTGAGGTLTVKLSGGTTTLTVPAGSGYLEYNLNLTTANSVGNFALSWAGTSSAQLDVGAASVAVPEPSTMVAGALMLLPFAASTLRLRKKTSA